MTDNNNITETSNRAAVSPRSLLTRLRALALRCNRGLVCFLRLILLFLLVLANLGWRFVWWLLRLPIRFVLWIWYYPFRAIVDLATLFGTIGLGFLIWDLYYQTEATISSAASDPKDPFYFPFILANNSHFFSIRNIKWECTIDYIINDKNNAVMDSRVAGSGFQAEILPNGVLDVGCDGFAIPPPIMDAKITIKFSYDTRILQTLLFSWEPNRVPPPTVFSWYGRSSNPQWIKGTNLRNEQANLPPRLRYDPATGQTFVKHKSPLFLK